MSETSDGASYDPAAEVVDLCRDLIRIDTTNTGDGDGPGERKAAEHVAGLLVRRGDRARDLRVRARPGEPAGPVGRQRR